MIAHLVLMQLHDISDTDFVAAKVLSLRGKIPGLAAIEGGETLIETANTWPLGFLMIFDDEKSVLSYQNHPAHVEIAQAIKGRLSGMGTCDVASQSFINTSTTPVPYVPEIGS